MNERIGIFVENEQSRVVMEGVREYGESPDVWIVDGVEATVYDYTKVEGVYQINIIQSRPAIVVIAENEGGYSDTRVNLLDLLRWVKKNRPDLWESATC